MTCHLQNLGGFAQRVPELYRSKLQGAFSPNFQCPTAAKLYVGRKYVLEEQERSVPLESLTYWRYTS